MANLPQWLTTITAALTAIMLLLAGIGNMFPDTAVGKWCLYASTNLRGALGKLPEQPPAAPTVTDVDRLAKAVIESNEKKAQDEAKKAGG